MPREKAFIKQTLQVKQSMFLKECFNAVEVDSKTSKYIVLKTIDTKGELFWFLGKGGAVRINRKNASTTSIDFQKHISLKYNKWCDSKLEEN